MEVLLASMEETKTLVAGTVLVALLVAESVHPFFEHFEAVSKDRGRHVARNLVIGLINSAMVATVFVGLWLAASLWAEARGFGLLNWLAAGGAPGWVHLAGALLILDAWTYVWHRLNHAVPFLWRFHRLHHSDNRLDVTTASRFHIGEIFFSSLLRIPLIALAGVYVWELVLYETVLFALVQFHHANLGLPSAVDRALRAVIVSPDMHKVHHSRYQPETDSNYASVLSVWDRIGRTFRMRDDPSTLEPGLDGFDDEAVHQSVLGMLATPLPFLDPDEPAETEVALTPDMKVAEVVERHPETAEVFRAHDCPDMRRGFFRLMSRLMSVRNAARVHRIPLEELMADLEEAIAADGTREEEASVREPEE